MIQRILKVVLFFCLLLVLGCERVVDLGLDAQAPKLVLVSNFSPLDTIECVVSKSIPVLETGTVEYVPDATVQIFKEDELLDQFQFISSDNPPFPSYYLSNSIVPEPGSFYTIRVEAPGFEPIQSTNYIPEAVEADSGNFGFNVSVTEENFFDNLVEFDLTMRILDPASEENYYHLVFYQEGFTYKEDSSGVIDTISQFFSLPLSITVGDDNVPLTPYVNGRGVLVRDEEFDGNIQVFNFSGSFLYHRFEQLLGDFIIEVRSVTREYYLYHSTLVQQYQASFDPLSDPVIIFNNVENGFGNFSGFNTRFYRVPVPE